MKFVPNDQALVIYGGFISGVTIGGLLTSLLYNSALLGRRVDDDEVLVLSKNNGDILGIVKEDKKFVCNPFLNKHFIEVQGEADDWKIKKKFDENVSKKPSCTMSPCRIKTESKV